MSESRRAAIFAAFVAAALCAFPHSTDNFESSNELSSLYLAKAIADRGDVIITREINRWGDITDKSERNGSHYSDKAPGAAWLAVVPILLTRPFDNPQKPFSRDQALAFARMFATIFPALLFAIYVGVGFNLKAPLDSLTGRKSLPIALIYLLATPAWIYSTLLYGHQLAAMCLFAGWLLAFDESSVPDNKKSVAAFASGFLIAYSVTCDYPVLWLAGCAGIYAIYMGTGKRPAFWIGVAIPVIALLAYHTMAFGSPLATGYSFKSYARDAAVHGQGVLGISFPSASALYGILLSPKRGLFFFSPVLAFAIVGLVYMSRMADRRLEFITIAAALAGHTLLIGGFGDWTAGWSYGPRHLVPMLPFMIPPMMVAMKSMGRIGKSIFFATAGISIANTALAVSTFPHAPRQLDNPLTDLFIALVKSHDVGPTLGEFGFVVSIIVVSLIALGGLAWIAIESNDERSAKKAAPMFVAGVVAAVVWVGLFASMKPAEGIDKHFAMGQVYSAIGDLDNAEKELIPMTLGEENDDMRIFAMYSLWKIAERKNDPRMALNWRRMYKELVEKKGGRPEAAP